MPLSSASRARWSRKTRASSVDRPAAANYLLRSTLGSSFGSILDKVKLSSTLEIWQVKEAGLKSVSIALGGLCFGMGLTAADLSRGGR